MRNYAETCKGICGALSKRILAWEEGTSQTWFLDQNSSSPCHLSFDLTYIGVWVFRFYKTILNLKTRLQKQNLKKNIYIFFHYHLSLLICGRTKLKIKFICYRMRLFYRMNFFTERFFSNRIKFFGRGYKYLF